MRIAHDRRPAAGLGRFTGRVGQLAGNPAEIAPAVRASVGHRLARVFIRLVVTLGTRLPVALSQPLLDQLYGSSRKYLEEQATLAFATTRFNQLTINAGAGRARRALVFLMRGQFYYAHNLHSYIIGCALRELGYRVSFVTCAGGVECCGINQNHPDYSLGPPEACGHCSGIVRNISAGGFDLISLNDYVSPDEEEQAEVAARDFGGCAGDYRLEGIPLLKTIESFLMRFFFGDRRRIRPDDANVLSHVRASARFMARYKKLLDQTRPSCLCFFNGLFFPESLFAAAAAKSGIPSLFVERGMRRDSIFISLNEPACHYRSERLWENFKQTVTDEQAREAAEYLRNRTAGPEDPTGRKRNLTDDRPEKYSRLAEKPYVIFFAPVAHDTAAMEKEGPTGDIFETLTKLALLAVKLRKRLVVRSHPDELGTRNPSHYTLQQFLVEQGLLHEEYVVCLDSAERWDPYRLAKYSEAVVVYNGTLGMELPALGYEVFNVGVSNYSNKGFTRQVAGDEDLAAALAGGRQRLSERERKLALHYLYFYVFVANIEVDSLLNEVSPAQFVLARSPESRQREQLEAIRERLAFLLGPQAVFRSPEKSR